MFKVISAEIKKSVSKPGIYVLAVILAIILVLGVFIYNPTEYERNADKLTGTNFNDIYNKFVNSTGYKVNADNTINKTVELIENYTINGVTYKAHIQSLQEDVKTALDNYIESGNNGSTKDRISQKRSEFCIALDNLYKGIDEGVRLATQNSFPILILNKDYENLHSYYTEGREFMLTEVEKAQIADRCAEYSKNYGSQIDKVINKLVFPSLTDEITSNYAKNEEGSKLFEVHKRLDDIMAEIDELVELTAGNPTVEQTYQLRELCIKYINTADSYKELVNYELLSNACSFISTKNQISTKYLSEYNKYNINTNLIRYKYIFSHNLTESDFAHPLAIGTTSNSQKNGYDYAYFILRLFSFVIIAYAIMSACHAIAGEIKDGSMRYLAIRPVSRTKILFGKMLAIIIMSTIFAIFSTIIALLVGGVVYGLESATILTIFNGTTAITLHPIAMLLIYVLSMLIELTVYVSIGLLLSCLFKSDLFAMTLMLLLYLINTLLPALVASPTSWLAFYPFSHIAIYPLFGSSVFANNSNFLTAILSAKVFTNTTLWLTLTITIVLIVVVNIISSRIFKRKEL